MADSQGSFGARLKRAVAAFNAAVEQPCLHEGEECVYCQRDRWADTSVRLKVQRQKDLRRGHCVRGEL